MGLTAILLNEAEAKARAGQKPAQPSLSYEELYRKTAAELHDLRAQYTAAQNLIERLESRLAATVAQPEPARQVQQQQHQQQQRRR
jgi:hypothetical protein